ncbi:hypothetical protein SAMN05720382_102759 [Polaromonas sp. JS666]|nr:hypothetical protein SAMN05720382_102759 [Polaromonas sp. JS666]
MLRRVRFVFSYLLGSLAEGGWPGLPGGNSLFFASPKKSKQKKGDPGVCVPPLRYGQPAVLGPGGVSLELATLRFAQTIAIPDPPEPALLGAYTRGWEKNTNTKNHKDTPRRVLVCIDFSLVFVFCPRSRLPRPGWAEQRRRRRDKGWRCLSEAQRSEFSQTPSAVEQRRLPVAQRRDPDCGSPFLLLTFLLAKQKKSE